MALEAKDLEPVLTGINETKQKQAANETTVIELKTKLSESETKAQAAETKAAELQTQLTEIKEWKVTKDEADKKNQEALDSLQISMKKKPLNAEPEKKSLSDAIGDALNEKSIFENIQALAENKKDREKKFQTEIKAVGDLSLSGGSYVGQAALNVIRPGYILSPNRKVHIRSLVPNGTIGAGTSLVIPYENGPGEGNIAPVAEGALKPQFDLDLAEKTSGIETIAGWLRVTRKMMNNVPGFISYLQARLPEKLLNVEDAQMLQGDGNSPNLKGIMTTGNYTPASTTDTILFDQLMSGISQLEELDRNATGILVRPAVWMDLFKYKAGGSEEYDAPRNAVFVNGVLYIAGVPIYASTAMPVGKYIVGDWQNGAQLLIQEGMRIEFFEQDSTNVRENKITVRIEETIAFPVYGNTFFIVGNTTAS